MLRANLFKLLFILYPAIVLADPVIPSSEQSIPTQIDIVDYQLEMAEATFSMVKTDQKKAELLNAYERAIERYCLRGLLATLSYKVPPSNDRCLKLIPKLLDLDSKNAVGICARDGIDSVTCRDAYQHQEVRSYDPSTSTIGKKTDNIGQTERFKQDLRLAESAYLDGHKNFVSNSNLANKAALLEKITAVLRLACIGTEITYPEIILGGAGTSSETKKLRLESPLDALKSQASKRPSLDNTGVSPETNLTKTKIGDTKTYRIRRIPNKCSQYAKDGLKYDPGYPEGICYLNGFFSPQCIDAMRQFMKRKPIQQSSKGATSSMKTDIDNSSENSASKSSKSFTEF